MTRMVDNGHAAFLARVEFGGSSSRSGGWARSLLTKTARAPTRRLSRLGSDRGLMKGVHFYWVAVARQCPQTGLHAGWEYSHSCADRSACAKQIIGGAPMVELRERRVEQGMVSLRSGCLAAVLRATPQWMTGDDTRTVTGDPTVTGTISAKYPIPPRCDRCGSIRSGGSDRISSRRWPHEPARAFSTDRDRRRRARPETREGSGSFRARPAGARACPENHGG